MAISTETLEQPKDVTLFGIEITPAKVTTLLAVLAPIITALGGWFDDLDLVLQAIILGTAGLSVITYLILYGIYVTKRKVAQLQLETNLAVTKK